MKHILPVILAVLLLCGCGLREPAAMKGFTSAPADSAQEAGRSFVSRFAGETAIELSDRGITVNGGGETGAVYTSRDIVYYADRDAYPSGNPYGEGTDADKHTAEEAQAHTVVNITEPGAYRVSGKLSAGQLRIDLGKKAEDDPKAVVELILDGADITCTVAPAILFASVYECDGGRDADSATPDVDTADAGAVLVLDGENRVSGSYVAKIFKDNDKEKKLWKQDGAIYSYMSMNVEGTGTLDLTAENEGLGTERHLSINGGNLNIRSGNDGINTNEDDVSVTTINGGNIHIIAGLGEEGDGIDSNGYLVINGGTVVSAANPASDAGLDSSRGSYINGGTVIALGAAMDWAETDSGQVTMNLRFAQHCPGDSSLAVTLVNGKVLFAYDPGEDEILGADGRSYQGAIISCGNFRVGESYTVRTGAAFTGTETGGVYDAATVTGFEGGKLMCYTGTDVQQGGFGGPMPGGEPPAMPEGEPPAMPEDGMDQGFGRKPDREPGQQPEGFEPGIPGEGQILFLMADKVNFFSGLTAAE